MANGLPDAWKWKNPFFDILGDHRAATMKALARQEAKETVALLSQKRFTQAYARIDKIIFDGLVRIACEGEEGSIPEDTMQEITKVIREGLASFEIPKETLEEVCYVNNLIFSSDPYMIYSLLEEQANTLTDSLRLDNPAKVRLQKHMISMAEGTEAALQTYLVKKQEIIRQMAYIQAKEGIEVALELTNGIIAEQFHEAPLYVDYAMQKTSGQRMHTLFLQDAMLLRSWDFIEEWGYEQRLRMGSTDEIRDLTREVMHETQRLNERLGLVKLRGQVKASFKVVLGYNPYESLAWPEQ